MSGLENKFSLFQVSLSQEQIEQWTPLSCTKDNPGNCAPTTLALTGVLPRSEAQEISDFGIKANYKNPFTTEGVEYTGVSPYEMTEILTNAIPRFDLIESDFTPINDVYTLLDQQLLQMNATILFFYNYYRGENGNIIHDYYGNRMYANGHAVTIGKDSNLNVFLFEAQHGDKRYVNEEVTTYIQKYDVFKYWLSKNKNKRLFSELAFESSTRKNANPEQVSKRVRRGGAKKRKTNRKSKVRYTLKKNKKVTKRKRR